MKKSIIPLFPLERVLFPKMVLPLHIFEDRYKEMIEYCNESEKPFGILSSDQLEPGAVGTTATIYKIIKRYDDGSLDLLTMGERRFFLKKLIREQTYYQGEIEYFEDLPGTEIQATHVFELIDLFRGFISRLGLKNDMRKELMSIVEQLREEQEISYVVGQTIGLDTDSQRELLAEVTPRGRLDRLTGLLRQQRYIHKIARNLFEDTTFDPNMN